MYTLRNGNVKIKGKIEVTGWALLCHLLILVPWLVLIHWSDIVAPTPKFWIFRCCKVLSRWVVTYSLYGVSFLAVAGDAEKTSMTCFHLRGGIIWCPKSLKGSIEQWAALIDDAADYGTHSKITTEFFQIEKAGNICEIFNSIAHLNK